MPTARPSGQAHSLRDLQPNLVLAREAWDELGKARQGILHSLYEHSFPSSERRDPYFPSPIDDLWVAYLAEQITGFATTKNLESENVLLQYMAVDSASRSRGIGGALFDYVTQELAERGKRQIVLEVEEPNGDSRRQRRINFYQRHGAERLQHLYRYFIVDFSMPGQRVPMILMWRPLIHSAVQPQGEPLRAILRSIYELEYSAAADPDYLEDLLSSIDH